jgi:hypothetical protein
MSYELIPVLIMAAITLDVIGTLLSIIILVNRNEKLEKRVAELERMNPPRRTEVN